MGVEEGRLSIMALRLVGGGVKDESTPYNAAFGGVEVCLVLERQASLRETRHGRGSNNGRTSLSWQDWLGMSPVSTSHALSVGS